MSQNRDDPASSSLSPIKHHLGFGHRRHHLPNVKEKLKSVLGKGGKEVHSNGGADPISETTSCPSIIVGDASYSSQVPDGEPGDVASTSKSAGKFLIFPHSCCRICTNQLTTALYLLRPLECFPPSTSAISAIPPLYTLQSHSITQRNLSGIRASIPAK